MNYIRLSELNGKINETIKASFSTVSFWVIADITNHTYRAQKNSHSFELIEKDPDSTALLARISGKAWGDGSMKIARFEKITGQKFTDNINVLINVSVQYHAVFGLQLNINDIDPNFTLGVLEQQRQATLEKLVTANPGFINKSGDRYITRNNQLKLNAVIQKIAVISSATSAGSEDFRHTLLNNQFGYQFFIDDYFTAVQGESNADQFLARIIAVFNSQKPYDAVVITRGGGAQTDFLIFDNYKIGRAVAKFPIPVITGIGHQKNESITDLMAHTQTKTPTQAAEFIIAHNRKYEEALLHFQKNIVIKSQQLFSLHFQSLSLLRSMVVNNARDILTKNKDCLVEINQATINISKSIIFKHKSALLAISSQMLSKPKIILYNRLNDIQHVVGNIKTFKTQYLKNKNGYLGHFSAVIKMMSPDNILNKGFAIVKRNNKITSNPDDVVVGEDIDIILSHTQIKSTVKQKSKYDGSDFNL
ncbi:MAG: exodeoxyribonuclease VII large subunit [Bacteroidota bacterium]|nr:exodeoxyribonuclease VII large subunit [Bacteroidota bacterium]